MTGYRLSLGICGTPGPDTIAVGTVTGKTGVDYTPGPSDPDAVISGKYSSIQMRTGAGADVIHGKGGRDSLGGGKGEDQLFGEGGRDEIDAVDNEHDVIDCGLEFDNLIYDKLDAFSHCEYKVKE